MNQNTSILSGQLKYLSNKAAKNRMYQKKNLDPKIFQCLWLLPSVHIRLFWTQCGSSF